MTLEHQPFHNVPTTKLESGRRGNFHGEQTARNTAEMLGEIERFLKDAVVAENNGHSDLVDSQLSAAENTVLAIAAAEMQAQPNPGEPTNPLPFAKAALIEIFLAERGVTENSGETVEFMLRRARRYLDYAIEALERSRENGVTEKKDELCVVVVATELALAKGDGTSAEKLIATVRKGSAPAKVTVLADYVARRRTEDGGVKPGSCRVSPALEALEASQAA